MQVLFLRLIFIKRRSFVLIWFMTMMMRRWAYHCGPHHAACESPRVKFILVHAKLVDTFYFYIPWSWNTRQSPRARSALNSSARPFKLRVSTIHDSKIKLLKIFILWNSCLKFFKQIKICWNNGLSQLCFTFYLLSLLYKRACHARLLVKNRYQ